MKNIILNQSGNEKVKPVGKSASQSDMVDSIKELKTILINCINTEVDEKLQANISWIEDKDLRIEELKDLISFTSVKSAGRNNLSTIYTNYRRLDIWKELYSDENEFKKEFQEASRAINDKTKAYTRYCNWSRVFVKLPIGSYLSCNVPNSYWRLIKKEDFDKMMEEWDN